MKQRALLVAVRKSRSAHSRGARSQISDSLDELQALAFTAGIEVLGREIQARSETDPALFIGRGKADQLQQHAQKAAVDLLIFDDELSPTQQRNLERQTGCGVLDRTQLILSLFAQRARTREGKLQVELAQLNYLRPRLTGRGVELSRLGGGIGTRGPGETKLETDRRRIVHRIARIRREMDHVRAQRQLQRERRHETAVSTVSLVGYTNAGKSTLFNALTTASVPVAPQLFSTLDPTLRKLQLPSRRPALLSDTVGFIRKLPHTLVTAFRATLEEVVESDLILHVVDRSNPRFLEQEEAVEQVLEELNARAKPILRVYNKVDLMDSEIALKIKDTVAVSALTGSGLERLLERIDELLVRDPLIDCLFEFPLSEGGALSLIQRRGRLLDQRVVSGMLRVHALLPQSVALKLQSFRL
ncbi:MAG: GTPase HflX [Acidobacteriia bacterium]|nr:GTPase HflX [Terriglobia bacterium]